MRTLTLIIFAAAVVICVSRDSVAAVQEYTNKAAWQAAAGSYTTIDFTGHPIGTPVVTLYQHLGITFTDGNDFIQNGSIFLNDGWGLDGGFVFPTGISFNFSEPRYTIAVDFPTYILFYLSYKGNLVHTSSWFGGTGPGHFAGLVSSVPFDRVAMWNPIGGNSPTRIDDLFFGPPIPAPGALALLGLGAITPRCRRRHVA
jgi:MYXO-CTERM domain-containing protein